MRVTVTVRVGLIAFTAPYWLALTVKHSTHRIEDDRPAADEELAELLYKIVTVVLKARGCGMPPVTFKLKPDCGLSHRSGVVENRNMNHLTRFCW